MFCALSEAEGMDIKMKIRIINLVNNFYMDDNSPASISAQNGNGQDLGQYCCLGYFDALDIKLLNDNSANDMSILRKTEQNTIEKFDGKSSRRNIICITNNDVKDTCFWKTADENPFLFISLIRIKDEQNDYNVNNNLQKFMDCINTMNNMMAYLTYGHSDVVVFKFETHYNDIWQTLYNESLHTHIFKMYSIFAIKENALENGDKIDDENVRCLLQAVVKDMTKVEEYIQKLETSLQLANTTTGLKIKYFYALGNSDIMIDIPNISLKKLLQNYKMGNLLTHTNPLYKETFFNIESVILKEVEQNNSSSVNMGV